MHTIASSAASARRWWRPLVSPWTMAALALASVVLPPLAVTAAFAVVSAAALRELSGPPFALRASGRVRPRERPFGRTGPCAGVLPYLCIPLQYGFVASGAYGAMALALPLFAALALPLWSVGAGDVRALAERSARRYFAIMIAVYALSHFPALATTGLPATGWPLAIAGVVVVALVAAGGARVMTHIGLPHLAAVGAVAFTAPPVFYAATWIASRTTG